MNPSGADVMGGRYRLVCDRVLCQILVSKLLLLGVKLMVISIDMNWFP